MLNSKLNWYNHIKYVEIRPPTALRKQTAALIICTGGMRSSSLESMHVEMGESSVRARKDENN